MGPVAPDSSSSCYVMASFGLLVFGFPSTTDHAYPSTACQNGKPCCLILVVLLMLEVLQLISCYWRRFGAKDESLGVCGPARNAFCRLWVGSGRGAPYLGDERVSSTVEGFNFRLCRLL